MTDRELKKEKDELKDILFSKIENVKNNNDIKKIAEKVDALNEYLDGDDSRIANLIDNIEIIFSPTQKSKIKKKITDILDNYDKIDKKSGVPIYNNEKKEKIKNLIKEIDDICNRNLWDRFINVLGIGS